MATVVAKVPKGWKPPPGWETMDQKELAKLPTWKRKEIEKRQARLKKKQAGKPAPKPIPKQLQVPALNRPPSPIEQAAGMFMKRSTEKAVRPSIEKALNAGFSVAEIRRATDWLYTHLYDNKRPKIGDRMQSVIRAMGLESPTTAKLYRAMTVPLAYTQFRGTERPVTRISQKGPTSWSTDPTAIDEFYKDKGKGFMGIVLSHTFSPQDIFVDFNTLSFYRQSHFVKEKEVLTMPGTYEAKVEGILIDQPEELDMIGVLPPWLDGKVRRKSKPSVLKSIEP